MGVPEWTLVAACLAVLVPTVRWYVDKRDTHLQVGVRNSRGALIDKLSVQEGQKFVPEVLNTGGSPARHMNVTLTFDPMLKIEADPDWEPGKPSGLLSPESRALTYPLPRLETNDPVQLPPIRVELAVEDRYRHGTHKWKNWIVWEVWWRWAGLKSGQNSAFLPVKVKR